jgi:hypothetical protein
VASELPAPLRTRRNVAALLLITYSWDSEVLCGGFMARTDLFHLICRWEPAVEHLMRHPSWQTFWDAIEEAGSTELRCRLPFAELARVSYDLSVGETARGAASFYETLDARLAPEAREAWGSYLAWFLPLAARLPDELGDATGVGDPDYQVWLSIAPRTVATLVGQAASLDWDCLRAAGEVIKQDDGHIPDFDSFEGLLMGYGALLKRAHRSGAGLVTLR